MVHTAPHETLTNTNNAKTVHYGQMTVVKLRQGMAVKAKGLKA